MVQIKRCMVENILGIKKIDFAPDGQSVTIGGKNAQGKTSAIWALIMALGGRDEMPANPVHKGEESGTVVVELDEFTVTLEVDAAKKSKLRVESKDGARYSSPQAMLNKLFGNLSFDPGLFKDQDRKQKFETLRQLMKLDFAELDSKYQGIYEQRREMGHTIKDLEGKLAGVTLFTGVPEKEVEIPVLLEQLKQVQAKNREFADMHRDAATHRQTAVRCVGEIQLCNQRIAELEMQIENTRKAIKHYNDERIETDEAAESLEKACIQGGEKESCAKAEELDHKIRLADETNRKVRSNQQVETLRSLLGDAEKSYNEMTRQLKHIMDTKAAALQGAKFPIAGLMLGDDDVLYNGIPLTQCSESQQWEVSTAIGFALNPQGILFMRSGGALDKDSRARIRERASALGVQLFLEVVDDADDVQILIQEGRISENRLAKEVKANVSVG